SGNNPLFTSTYYYDGVGRLASVAIDDDRDRAISFAYAPEMAADRSSAAYCSGPSATAKPVADASFGEAGRVQRKFAASSLNAERCRWRGLKRRRGGVVRRTL